MWLALFIAAVVFLIFCYVLLWILSRRRVTKYSFDQFGFCDDDPVRTIVDDGEVHLTLVVPAYNEEKRIKGMLDESLDFLKRRVEADPDFRYEVVVVNDGSKDETVAVVKSYIADVATSIAPAGSMRLLDLVTNFGKGFAVRQGILRSRGEFILMLDADAASRFGDLEKLEAEITKVKSDGLGVALGSRYLGKESSVERDCIRDCLSSIFHIAFKFITGIRDIKDSQCGFKLFTRRAAAMLFTNMRIDRWAMDIELVMIAKRFKIALVEVPINWREVEGSKFNLSGMLGVLRDLFLIRAFLDLRLWKLRRAPVLPGQGGKKKKKES